MSQLFNNIASKLSASLISDEYSFYLKHADYTLKISGISKAKVHDSFVECEADDQIKLCLETYVPRSMLGQLVDGYAKVYISSDRSVTSICNSITKRIIPDAIQRKKAYDVLKQKEDLFIQQFNALHLKLNNVDNAHCEHEKNHYRLGLMFNDNNERFSLTADTFYRTFNIKISMARLSPLALLADMTPRFHPLSIQLSHSQTTVMHQFTYQHVKDFNDVNQLLDCLLLSQATMEKIAS